MMRIYNHIEVTRVAQGLANCTRAMPIPGCVICGCFDTRRAVLRVWGRDLMAHKAESTYYLLQSLFYKNGTTWKGSFYFLQKKRKSLTPELVVQRTLVYLLTIAMISTWFLSLYIPMYTNTYIFFFLVHMEVRCRNHDLSS